MRHDQIMPHMLCGLFNFRSLEFIKGYSLDYASTKKSGFVSVLGPDTASCRI